jgi:hypothetical protein
MLEVAAGRMLHLETPFFMGAVVAPAAAAELFLVAVLFGAVGAARVVETQPEGPLEVLPMLERAGPVGRLALLLLAAAAETLAGLGER